MDYLNEFIELLKGIEISDDRVYENYETGFGRIMEVLRQCKISRKALYIIGNGGSAGIAQHMTADFLKNGGFKTCSMYGQPTITCISNDLTYEYVFCKQLELLADSGDVLIAISSSGESTNIIKAVDTMKCIGGEVITLTGFNPDNMLRKMGDINIYVHSDKYGMVESVHNVILQQLVDTIVERDGVAMEMDIDE